MNSPLIAYLTLVRYACSLNFVFYILLSYGSLEARFFRCYLIQPLDSLRIDADFCVLGFHLFR